MYHISYESATFTDHYSISTYIYMNRCAEIQRGLSIVGNATA
jgi:hypothetical protein